MGYWFSEIYTEIDDKTSLGEYIGSRSISSCAGNGAFDSPVSSELEELADEDEEIIAIVDGDGVEHFLNVLKYGSCNGRDIEKMIDIVEKNYKDGFMIRG